MKTLNFKDDQTMIIYHSFICLTFICPLIGAILADSFWGKFKTIYRFLTIYILGGVTLTGASIVDMFGSDIQKYISMIGLFLIYISAGIIKPSGFTFAGDQFQFPQQQQQFQHYIIKFIMSLEIGSVLSSFLMPELRHSVHCFGKSSCFPLAFGVLVLTELSALAALLSGGNLYVKKKPERNVITRTFGCIFYALGKTFTSGTSRDNVRFLDRAKPEYTDEEIADTRSALNVITVFTAYPVFWALNEQQTSRWTLQATLMNGRFDFMNWTIKPDQFHTISPMCELIFLILFDGTLNPLLAKIGIRKSLQKITLSGFLATMAFIAAALLEFRILGISTVIPAGEGRLNIYNGYDCDVHARSLSLNVDRIIQPLGMMNVNYALVSREDVFEIILKFDRECTFVPENFELNTTVTVSEGKEISYYLTRLNTSTITLNRVGDYDNYKQNKQGNPSLRVLIDDSFGFNDNISLISSNENRNSYSFSPSQRMHFNEVHIGKYNLWQNGQMTPTSMEMIPATFYTITLQKNGNRTDIKLFSKYKGNYLHIFWQFPQYFFMISSITIFAVTRLDFTFTEAPINLKTFMYSFDLLTMAGGNLLVVIISTISIKNQAFEYLLYSGLMCADSLILAYFSVAFQSTNSATTKTKNENINSLNEAEVNSIL
ncbi:solute carrier family 15 member 2-like isoform X2 [Sipha flava]|nr:solute carrier family 15 member 2-like isoform X2 [Sipha flava]